MRLLKESNATGDLIGDPAPGKLQLQLDCVIMRPVEHGDLVEVDTFITQFQNPLRDKLSLLSAVVQRHQSRSQRF